MLSHRLTFSAWSTFDVDIRLNKAQNTSWLQAYRCENAKRDAVWSEWAIPNIPLFHRTGTLRVTLRNSNRIELVEHSGVTRSVRVLCNTAFVVLLLPVLIPLTVCCWFCCLNCFIISCADDYAVLAVFLIWNVQYFVCIVYLTLVNSQSTITRLVSSTAWLLQSFRCGLSFSSHNFYVMWVA